MGGGRSGIPNGMPQGTPTGVPAYRRPIGRRHFSAAGSGGIPAPPTGGAPTWGAGFWGRRWASFASRPGRHGCGAGYCRHDGLVRCRLSAARYAVPYCGTVLGGTVYGRAGMCRRREFPAAAGDGRRLQLQPAAGRRACYCRHGMWCDNSRHGIWCLLLQALCRLLPARCWQWPALFRGGGLPPGRNGAAYWRHDIWPDGGNEPPAAIAAGGRCVPPPGMPGGGGWGGMNDEAPWEPREWRAFPAGLRAGRCGAGYGRHGMVLAKASTVCRKGLRAGGAKKAGRAGALGERGPGGKAGLEGTRTWKAGVAH